MTDHSARKVLMSIELAEELGVADRLTDRTEVPPTGVIVTTTDELLAWGASRVEWGEPDELGRYTPALYRDTK